MVVRKLIRADGTSKEIPGPMSIEYLRNLIKADTLDTVTLRHMGHPTHVMLLDDAGHEKHSPINKEASELYWANCRPGTTHPIRGDVVVVLDEDFGI